MKSLFNFNQQTLKLALASTLALGAATMSGSSVAGTSSSTVTVNATLAAACEVTPSITIGFGSVNNLASASAVAQSSTFEVACTSDAVPKIYTTGTRSMIGPSSTALPFFLSLTNTGSNDLPTSLGAAADLTILQDGTMKPVTLFAKIPNSSFATAKPTGVYTANVTVSVDY